MPQPAPADTLQFRLTAAHHEQALGIPAARGIMLSWALSGSAALSNRGATVVVARDAERAKSPASGDWAAEGVHGTTVRYDGPTLTSRDVRYWTVTVALNDGTTITSEPARFEVGLERNSDWSAHWISSPLLEFRREMWDPLPLFRSTFTIVEADQPARLYATALGLYRVWLNGREVSADALLRPGWTNFDVRVLHQTFDVSALMRPGRNVIAVELARGWYAGRLGLQREPALYGEQPALMVQLESGGNVVSVTGPEWRYHHGDIMQSDLMIGETQDLRQRQAGWTELDFDDSRWQPVSIRDDISVPVTPQPHEHVRTFREHEGTLVRAHARGPAVFDFGQNIVGWTRLTTATLPKADVIIRHGETLTPDDLVWRDNLRGAFQEDRYTTGDAEIHTLEPRFTLHGFRYAEVWGMAPRRPYMALELRDESSITAISVAGQRSAGSFSCSDPDLTSVAQMVEWTVRDNMIEVITDCPQRDERLGWLGDAGVIAQSAAYFLDMASFVAKFARDAADSQGDDGVIRSYVPPVPPGTGVDGAPGWADGYVRLIHLAAERYGDLATASEHFDSLARYLAWVDTANPSGIRTERVGSDFSDWLSLPEDPDEPPHPGYAYTGARSTSSKRVVATAHTIRSWDQFADIAEWLGHHDQARHARQRAEEIRGAYVTEFLDERGWIEGDTQTVYAQALGYGILHGEARDRAVARLADKVREIGHVTVGIHGSEHILPALARHGHVDLAESLLMREDMPSWKHMVRMGATTVWEKWDGIAEDGTMSTAEMNSFNHCALGAVGEFLFESVAGLNARAAARTGEVIVAPIFLSGLDWASCTYESVAGPIATSWKRDGSRIRHTTMIAPGLRVVYTAPDGYRVIDGGNPAATVLDPGHHEVVVEPV